MVQLTKWPGSSLMGGEAEKAVLRFSSSVVSRSRELKFASVLRRRTCVAGGRVTSGTGGVAHVADGRGPAGVELGACDCGVW